MAEKAEIGENGGAVSAGGRSIDFICRIFPLESRKMDSQRGWRWRGTPRSQRPEGERQVMAAVAVIYRSVVDAHANT